MSTPLLPWQTHSVPLEIQKELIRRKTNIGLNYKTSDGWNKDGGDWETHKGPMTSWVRFCSNGVGRPEVKKSGFILSGGKSFYQTYGVTWNNTTNQQVLGYTPNGELHTLDYDKNTSQFPIHVPSPEIIRVETVIQKELFRRAWVHWTCFSSKQLEYMTPYFLIPGITCVVEFGWNHFNQNSLIDLTNEDQLTDFYFKNPYPLYNENILKSNGNYDVVFGMVTNFEWSVEGNKINCMTEITSKDRLYAGIPISTIVAEKKEPANPKTELVYFSNIKQLCNTDFIKNLKSISSADSLDDVEKTNSNQQLLNIIRGGTTKRPEMKKEYWRGVFYGRDNKNITKSKQLEFEWTMPIEGDFDVNQNNDENVWVNMGFLVELINRSIALPSSAKDIGFFEINVDESVIGAHPNHISNDGNTLLIPNAFAPKFMYGDVGLETNGSDGDYHKQFLIEGNLINKDEKNKSDPFWHADYQLTEIFKQGWAPYRDNIDEIINSNRYVYDNERTGKSFSFPFSTEEVVDVQNRVEKATYDPYFYGYFKDLYFNVKKFISIVNNESVKTYSDLYKVIFDEINRAGGNFWELSLMTNDNTSQMLVVDNKMLPSGNNKSKPWYFDYMDADQLIQSLGFKPKLSDAQAFRAVFGETNNSGSRTVTKEENDLLNYQFEDRILNKKKDVSPTIISNKDPTQDAFLAQVKNLQHIIPNESYQFTVMVGDKPYFRRLVLPDPEMLNCLLDDHDVEKNQKYTGLQPITVEVGLQGIGGLRTFMSFLIRNLPNPYNHKDVCYRIADVHHTLQDGKWDTVIKAGILPLKGYVKQKLGIEE